MKSFYPLAGRAAQAYLRLAVKSPWIGPLTLLIVALACAVLATIQRSTLSVPAWSIRFVDQLGRPLAGLRVQQSWQDYSLEDAPHVAVETTNGSGVAVFPARYVRASLLKRLLGPLESFLFGGGIHASYGAHSSVVPRCRLKFRGPHVPMLLNGRLPDQAILEFDVESRFSGAGCARVEVQARDADQTI
jgi:hypothetical protein